MTQRRSIGSGTPSIHCLQLLQALTVTDILGCVRSGLQHDMRPEQLRIFLRYTIVLVWERQMEQQDLLSQVAIQSANCMHALPVTLLIIPNNLLRLPVMPLTALHQQKVILRFTWSHAGSLQHSCTLLLLRCADHHNCIHLQSVEATSANDMTPTGHRTEVSVSFEFHWQQGLWRMQPAGITGCSIESVRDSAGIKCPYCASYRQASLPSSSITGI